MNKWQHFLQQTRTPKQHIKEIFTSIMCLDLLQIITWCWEQSSRQGEEWGINNSVEEARERRAGRGNHVSRGVWWWQWFRVRETMDLLKDDQLVFIKHKRCFWMVDRHMAAPYFWRLPKTTNYSTSHCNHSLIAQVRTSDASYAVSTATSTSSADSHCCKCCHQDNSQDNDESVLHPPAQQLLDAGIVRVPMPVGWRLSRQSTS